MEYRFSVTGRLLAVGIVAALALLVLLFALGFLLGQRLAPQGLPDAPAAAATPLKGAP